MLNVGAARLSDHVLDSSSSSENDENNVEEDLYRRMAGGCKKDSSECRPDSLRTLIEFFASLVVAIGLSEDFWTVLRCRRTKTPISNMWLVREDFRMNMVFMNLQM